MLGNYEKNLGKFVKVFQKCLENLFWKYRINFPNLFGNLVVIYENVGKLYRNFLKNKKMSRKCGIIFSNNYLF